MVLFFHKGERNNTQETKTNCVCWLNLYIKKKIVQKERKKELKHKKLEIHFEITQKNGKNEVNETEHLKKNGTKEK